MTAVEHSARAQRWFPVLLGGLLVAALGAYVLFRQKYVGACDWFGYYELSRLFLSGRTVLDTVLPIDRFPSIVPLGFFPVEGRGIPQYTPGYPALLALGGLVHAEFLVNPLVGAISVVVMFVAARDLTGNRWIALATAAAWAFLPVVAYGATTLMSDLVATTPLVASYLLYRRGKIPWSAILLAFSFSVRPTNALYCVPFALPLIRDRQVLRFGLWMIPALVPYGVYNHFVYGVAWKTGYPDIAGDLVRSLFARHLGFYLWETFRNFGPLWLFIVFGCRELRRSEAVFYVLWTGIFIFFYSFWRSGGEHWWWTRFILPGYPPLYFLAALGVKHLWQRAQHTSVAPAARRRLLALLVALLALTPLYHVRLGMSHRNLWRLDKHGEYLRVVRETEKFAAPGSFVGSIEFGGAFRVYSQVVPFVSSHSNSLELVAEMLRREKDVYLLVEPLAANDPTSQELLRRFRCEKLREIPLWSGVTLCRLHNLDTPP